MASHEDMPWREEEDDDVDDDETDLERVGVDEGPGIHDEHLMEEGEPDSSVVCPHCGKFVWSHAKRCHHCKTHFGSEAWQLMDAPTTNGWWPRMRMWMVVGIVMMTVVALLLLAVLERFHE